MAKIVVLGDSGLLGQALIQHWGNRPDFEVVGVSTSQSAKTSFWRPLSGTYEHWMYDVTEKESSLFKKLSSWSPDLLVNSIGLVNVSECETQRDRANLLNSEVPSRFAMWAARNKVRFFHISTDHVFDGRAERPYIEEDIPRPINAYAQTKLSGEQSVLDVLPDALVVRTNIVGFKDRPGHPTFAEWLCQALYNRENITLFDDYVNSMIHVHDLAVLLDECFDKSVSGIIHLTTTDALSKYDFGKNLASNVGADFSNVRKGHMRGSNMRPIRPCFLALDTQKAEKILGHNLPTSDNAIHKLSADFMRRYKEKRYVPS